MELTCLSCTGTFSASDADPAGRRSLVCPLCNREQRWIRQDKFEFVVNSEQRPEQQQEVADSRRPSSSGMAFKRPMQAFGGRRSSGSGQSLAATPPLPNEPLDKPADEPALAPELPPDVAAPILNNPEGWVVRSPSGLVLEFPSSDLVVAWSAVLDNPVPYHVSHVGSPWASLDEVLKEIKRGRRPSQSMIKTLDGGAISGGSMMDPVKRDRMEMGLPISGTPTNEIEAPLPAKRTTTQQFEFKMAESKPKGMPRWAVMLIVTLAVLASVGLAAYVLM